ncbi:DUF4136 domain-containing protein [Shewanella sp. D64]|uniref:DUF4136 domain-containing protein n=1 Tax=unclassified Shewanella TaxID=196818 RepID=UPI0022BA6F8C|nr:MULTISPECIES: DUF4136 domain-containing protein [unclassified Shewanella]MEC4727283.1 DUF4136 domain-containing protein [Shewanella sp. D64]MEC4739438.1 DUF4136 domain-containing protein [Shewanella sp. E94]WBJ96767.1 DUF4136 domain-containing protein [Shewanella sp. MTB7]
MKLFNLSSLLLSCVLLSACTSTPKSDYDVDYDFTKLSTFQELAPPQSDDPLTTSRIQTALANTLEEKGFTRVESKADFLVTFGYRVDDKPKDSGLSIGLGTGTWGSSGGVSVGTSVGVPIGSNTAKIQTIQIDILDPVTNRLIWRGTDGFDYDAGGEQKVIDTLATVNKILALFPPQK